MPRSLFSHLTAMSGLLIALGCAPASNRTDPPSNPPAHPPAAPANLRAVPGDGHVSLTWDLADGATGYRVFAAPKSTEQFQLAAERDEANARIASLANGTPFVFAVSAFNASGEGERSQRVEAMPAAGVVPEDLEIAFADGTAFPSLPVDQQSFERSFRVRNASNTPLQLAGDSAAVITGPNAADFSVSLNGLRELSVGREALMNLVFRPMSSGPKVAQLEITFSAGGQPATATVSLSGRGLPWAYLGQRGFTPASAGSYLKVSDPLDPNRSGNSGDRSIAIDVFEGIPYVAFKDNSKLFNPENVETGRLSVMRFAGGAWESVGEPGFSEGDAMWIDLEVHKGVPYVFFNNSNDKNARVEGTGHVMRFAGGVWSKVGGSDATPGSAAYGSLLVSDAGAAEPEIYISFQEGATYSDGHCYASVRKLSGSTWEYVGKPNFSAPESGLNDGSSLAMSQGELYLAFDGGLMKYDAASATWLWLARFQAHHVSLAADGSGVLYAAFADAAASDRVRVVRWAGGALETVGEPLSEGAGSFVSLRVDQGKVYVSLQDRGTEARNRAAMMVLENGAWRKLGGDYLTFGEANHVASALDDGIPIVAFKDEDVRAMPAHEGTGKASAMKLDLSR